MFELLAIKQLNDNLQRLQKNQQHRLTFQLFYTLKGVPDSFTGIVFHKENDSALSISHFNDPKGNSRKVIALKNKLKPGVFDGIKVILSGLCDGQNFQFPYTAEALAELSQRDN